MNLVIDDAVEVRLATKTEEEKRRPLGMDCDSWMQNDGTLKLANTALQAKSSSRATTSPSFKPSNKFPVLTLGGQDTAHHLPRAHQSASHAPLPEPHRPSAPGAIRPLATEFSSFADKGKIPGIGDLFTKERHFFAQF